MRADITNKQDVYSAQVQNACLKNNGNSRHARPVSFYSSSLHDAFFVKLFIMKRFLRYALECLICFILVEFFVDYKLHSVSNPMTQLNRDGEFRMSLNVDKEPYDASKILNVTLNFQITLMFI